MHLVLAGGTEMMSHQPLGTDYPSHWPDDFPFPLVHQGISAEMMAEKWGLRRESLDDFSYNSHMRAMHAMENCLFDSQIMPVIRPDGQTVSFDRVCALPTAKDVVKACFSPMMGGTQEPSQVSDGAAAVLGSSPGGRQLIPWLGWFLVCDVRTPSWCWMHRPATRRCWKRRPGAGRYG
jgi:acetyl-CoA acetyltransferase